MKTQKEVRDYFWETHPYKKEGNKRQNDYPADIRMAFCLMVDLLHRDGTINDKLANKVTL